MQMFVPTLFAAGILAAAAAHAEELRPIQASSIELGGVCSVAYYTNEKDGFRVVATLAADENAMPVRFAATLLPGQKTVLSVPREQGLDPIWVEISRIGSRVVISKGKGLAQEAHSACGL